MLLKLLDMEDYIKRNNLGQVTTGNIYESGPRKTFDENGLWSESIFGSVGSRERRSRFAYIDLHTEVINPTIYKLLYSVSENVRDIILEKKRFTFDKNKFKEDSIEGKTGIHFLCELIPKINFELIAKNGKEEVGRFLNDNKKLLTITKYLVIPAGVRDLRSTRINPNQELDPINESYTKLIAIVNHVINQVDEDFISVLTNGMQKEVNNIYVQIENRLKGKTGFLRGSMLKKSVDYTARIVAVSSPDIPLGKAGLPWHTVLTLFEPFFIHYVYKKNPEIKDVIKKYLNIPEDKDLSIPELKNFNLEISREPEKIKDSLKYELIEAAKEISKDKNIIIKRDPATMRDHYAGCEIEVLSEGRSIIVNGLICGPLGLDFDGDTLSIYPMLTKQANDQARMYNPRYNKSAWVSPLNISKHHYMPELDVVSTMYAITKE